MSRQTQSSPPAKGGDFWTLYSPRLLSNPFASRDTHYDRLADGVTESGGGQQQHEEKPRPAWVNQTTSSRLRPLLWFLWACSYVLVAGMAFGAGVGFGSSQRGEVVEHSAGHHDHDHGLEGVAQRVPLPFVNKQFHEKSDFLLEPPQGEGSGNMSEPIWDELIPNGLGYFRDGKYAPVTSIPTVFHELHCLYILRRAYYQESTGLEAFDFGKDRSAHVAHCFDYLRQGITCHVDTTVEPAVGDYGNFLGNGFDRQCHDFEALKTYVAQHRMFDATGFLAAGLDHGHAHVTE